MFSGSTVREMSSRLTGIKVNFVCPQRFRWPELVDEAAFPISEEILSRRSGGLMNNWVLRPYHGLRALGLPVSLSESAVEGSINVVSAHDFGRRDRKSLAFVVCARGDAHFPMLANFVINQNFVKPSRGRIGAIHHFPQPGLIGRRHERGTIIEKVSFKGHLAGLDVAFRSEAFRNRLREIGVELEVDARNKDTQVHNWSDYSDTDIVLAVRNLTNYDAGIKPASKLVNAWRAGVPALLGPEPAFENLRKTSLDFIAVRTPDEALIAIKRLKDDPITYSAMVENGIRRGEEFSEERIIGDWLDALEGPIKMEFEAWHRNESIKAYGNAVVPQVVYEIFKAIQETNKAL